jgi:GNAT superfamily N-acetyltransferase
MSSVEIRPFRREDRDQLTGLVNAHIAAVIPGITVSVNTVMSQLEREPGEAVVDPWVIERKTLVAVEREAVVAAAHLHRFGAGDEVSDSYRDAASIHWLLSGRNATEAADELMAECLLAMDAWNPHCQYAGGELPSVATYGIPAVWPHIRDLYVRSGFVHRGRVEIVLAIDVEKLPRTTAPPIESLVVKRAVGANGVRFSAALADDVVAMIEVELRTISDARSRQLGWADIGTLKTAEEHLRNGIGSWLLGIAADWLRLGGIQRLLAYASPGREDELRFLVHHGFRELVRTERGWIRE